MLSNDVVDRLASYVCACEATSNGNSQHCQDCRDAIDEIKTLRELVPAPPPENVSE